LRSLQVPTLEKFVTHYIKENKICIPARIQHPPFPKAPNLIHVQKVEWHMVEWQKVESQKVEYDKRSKDKRSNMTKGRIWQKVEYDKRSNMTKGRIWQLL
jgi:hypothetical protein